MGRMQHMTSIDYTSLATKAYNKPVERRDAKRIYPYSTGLATDKPHTTR